MEGNGEIPRINEEVELNLGLSTKQIHEELELNLGLSTKRIREEVELNLGLSTNGRFGVDPARVGKICRSSSVANPAFAVVGVGGGPEPLSERTRSLPTETEEEALRRRKELEYVCRGGGNRGKSILGEGVIGNLTSRRLPDVSVLGQFGNRDVGESFGSVGPPRAVLKPRTVEVCHQGSHVPSPKDAQIATPEPPKNPMLDMPLVTTKDTRPNSRKVQGILYRYKTGEEIKILCVCHGVLLTPKEFVAHGGGGDIEHPLKHIVILS